MFQAQQSIVSKSQTVKTMGLILTNELLNLTQTLRGKARSLVERGNIGEYVGEDRFEPGKERFKLSFKEWLGKLIISLEVTRWERKRGRKATPSK